MKENPIERNRIGRIQGIISKRLRKWTQVITDRRMEESKVVEPERKNYHPYVETHVSDRPI